MKKLKWITISQYVDEETGEKLTKAIVKEKYNVVKKIKIITKTNYDGKTETGYRNYAGCTEITNICTRRKQLTLW